MTIDLTSQPPETPLYPKRIFSGPASEGLTIVSGLVYSLLIEKYIALQKKIVGVGNATFSRS